MNPNRSNEGQNEDGDNTSIEEKMKMRHSPLLCWLVFTVHYKDL